MKSARRAEMGDENKVIGVDAERYDTMTKLSASYAHDINNMLTAILGNITLIKTYSTIDEELIDSLNEAETAAVRARTLTQKFLEISKNGPPARKVNRFSELLED